MKTKIIVPNKLKSIQIIDPNSDRLRKCPNPECNKLHYVKHLGKDYCDPHCADQHYNHKRRLKKQAESMLHDVKEQVDTILEAEAKQPLNIVQAKEPIAETKEDVLQVAFNSNIVTLDSLPLHTIKGSIFHIEDLLEKNFVFKAFSGRGKLYNVDPKYRCHFLQYNKYRIYRLRFDKILIVKTT
jgi:hypothetical protein